jgi:hypothetical protein
LEITFWKFARIGIGIRDNKISKKLQLDSNLTLEKAIQEVKLKELVNHQQREIKPEAVGEKKYTDFVERKQNKGKYQENSKSWKISRRNS